MCVPVHCPYTARTTRTRTRTHPYTRAGTRWLALWRASRALTSWGSWRGRRAWRGDRWAARPCTCVRVPYAHTHAHTCHPHDGAAVGGFGAWHIAIARLRLPVNGSAPLLHPHILSLPSFTPTRAASASRRTTSMPPWRTRPWRPWCESWRVMAVRRDGLSGTEDSFIGFCREQGEQWP